MKIESIQNQGVKSMVAQQMPLKQNVSFTGNVQMVSLMDSKISNSLKSIISFKGSGEAEKVNPLNWVSMDNPIIKIPDLFSLPYGKYELPSHVENGDDKLNAQLKKLNPNGLKISVEKTDNVYPEKEIVITDGKDNKIFKGTQRLEAKAPKVAYAQGKFKPTIVITDESLKAMEEDGEYKYYAQKIRKGSKVSGDGFEYTMPGEARDYVKGKPISFTGNMAVTTLNLEPKTVNAINLYLKSNLAEKTTRGAYAEELKSLKDQQPTVVIPAGGFGERFYNMTMRENPNDEENKPSYRLPTKNEYRTVATSLNAAAAMGVLDDGNTNLVYLSQNHDISGDNVIEVDKYKTDGGAIAHGLRDGHIANDKDMIVLNGDIIFNADISRAYKSLKDLPNAALVIPYYPVNAERAKTFGLLGVEGSPIEDVASGNARELKSFVEKTPYTNVEPKREDFKTDEAYKKAVKEFEGAKKARKNPESDETFLANPGIYLMSKEATKVLKDMLEEDPNSTGLGGSVMPRIVEMCNQELLKNEKDEPMKAYTVPLLRQDGQPAFWDDIGSAEAYMNTIRDIAKETKEKGTGIENKFYGMPEFVLKDFMKNADLDTGLLYMSDKARKAASNFRTKYDASLSGNIFVDEA